MRSLLRILHRYLGLLLVLPLAALGLTGSILAFEPLLKPTFGSGHQPPVSADAVMAVARGAVPEDLQATRYVPPTAGTPAEIWFAPLSGPRGRGTLVVRVDPSTMRTIGPPETPGGLIELSRRLHHDFLIPDYGGRSIIGWVGIGLVLLCVTGIPIWWPTPRQWRAAFTISVAAQGFPFHRRLHGAIGIWVVVFLLVSGATGAVLGFPRTVREALGVAAPVRPGPSNSPARAARGAATPGRGLDAALALATEAAPGTVPRMVLLPGTNGPIRVMLAPPGAEGMARTATITIDGQATRVLNVQDASSMAGAELSLRWARDVHFGQGVGIVWRWITIITGLALPVFAFTGAAMWILRNRNRRRAVFARGDALSPGE